MSEEQIAQTVGQYLQGKLEALDTQMQAIKAAQAGLPPALLAAPYSPTAIDDYFKAEADKVKAMFPG